MAKSVVVGAECVVVRKQAALCARAAVAHGSRAEPHGEVCRDLAVLEATASRCRLVPDGAAPRRHRSLRAASMDGRCKTLVQSASHGSFLPTALSHQHSHLNYLSREDFAQEAKSTVEGGAEPLDVIRSQLPMVRLRGGPGSARPRWTARRRPAAAARAGVRGRPRADAFDTAVLR